MLEYYAQPPKASWKRRALFTGSIVVHGVAAVGLIVYSIFHIEELVPPELTLTFFSAPPPPPPPPPPAATKAADPKPKPTFIKASLTIPTVKAPETPQEAPSEEPAGVAGGVVGGVAGGVAGGVVGGVVGSPAPAAPPPPQAPPKMVASFVFDKERLTAPDPHLPQDFVNRNPKQTFTGTYRICVGTDGRITEVTAVRGIAGLDGDLISQLKRTWTYKPQPVPVCSVRNFVFKIN